MMICSNEENMKQFANPIQMQKQCLMIVLTCYGWSLKFNLIFVVSMLGLGYYTVLTVFSPNTLVDRYDLGEKSVPIIRIVGSFVLPTLIIGVWIILEKMDHLDAGFSLSLIFLYHYVRYF